MRVLQADISNNLHRPLAIMTKKGNNFSSALHAHPETELVYIRSGSGKRIIGNEMSEFESGELVLIGSGLPHRWIHHTHDDRPNTINVASSIVAYVNMNIFDQSFYSLEECQKLSELLIRSKRGLRIIGETRIAIIAKMERLLKKTGMERILGLLEILHRLSLSHEVEYLTKETQQEPEHFDLRADRLANVYQYISTNFHRDIPLDEVAAMSSLTRTAFCRLFKKRTQKHFVEYLNEIRIAHACENLQHTDTPVSLIAASCGFKTVSNFNKRFKKEKKITPKDYRKQFLLLAGVGVKKVC